MTEIKRGAVDRETLREIGDVMRDAMEPYGANGYVLLVPTDEGIHFISNYDNDGIADVFDVAAKAIADVRAGTCKGYSTTRKQHD